MKSIKGSKTEKNLIKSFAGECQAQRLYQLFSQIAKEQGYIQVSDILLETSKHESVHAGLYYKYLEGNTVEMNINPATGKKFENILDMLKALEAGERMEATQGYPIYSQIAKEEGFDEIASLYNNIASCESYHAERFGKLAKKIENGAFAKDTEATWECINCGFIFVGKQAPNKCPVCHENGSYFQIKREKWLD